MLSLDDVAEVYPNGGGPVTGWGSTGRPLTRFDPGKPQKRPLGSFWGGRLAIALGYEDLNDHDELRHDPMMAVLAGKLVARREGCAPVAGKSTLNRLELSKLEPTR